MKRFYFQIERNKFYGKILKFRFNVVALAPPTWRIKTLLSVPLFSPRILFSSGNRFFSG
ncbi:hypothetical protein YC2023_030498 [Brassica napus]